MFYYIKKGLKTTVVISTIGISLKSLQLTANDDWDNIVYIFRKEIKKLSKQYPIILPSLPSLGIDINKENDNVIKKKKIVLLGSGWAALSFLQKIDEDKFDVVIVSPRSFFFYTPLLAGTATGTVSHSSIIEPIRWYCERAGHEGAVFLQAECKSIDLKNKKISYATVAPNILENDPKAGKLKTKDLTLDYDHLIVAVGAEPNTFNIPGVKENATFMKEIEDALTVQKQILHRLEMASALQAAGAPDEEVQRLLHWIIIGGGPTGVELSAELTDFLKSDIVKYFPKIASKVKITLIEGLDRLLNVFEKETSSYARTALEARGAEVLCSTFVTKIAPDHVAIKVKNSNGVMEEKQIKYGIIVWAGGIATRPFVNDLRKQVGEKEQNSRFGLIVDKKFRVKGVPDGSVWALGDCAVSGCAPTAQAANQQGKYLGRLFRDTGLDSSKIDTHDDFVYHYKGSLAYVGAGKGVAEIKGLWDLKNLWDTHPVVNDQVRVQGSSAFAIWRSLYFSKLMSIRNQAQVGFDWAKASFFGRDISTPYPMEIKTDNNVKK